MDDQPREALDACGRARTGSLADLGEAEVGLGLAWVGRKESGEKRAEGGRCPLYSVGRGDVGPEAGACGGQTGRGQSVPQRAGRGGRLFALPAGVTGLYFSLAFPAGQPSPKPSAHVCFASKRMYGRRRP